MPLAHMSDDELEKFRDTIRRHNKRLSDFELWEREAPMGAVDVRYKPLGTSRNYRFGSGSGWPAALERDLEAGEYDRK